MSDEQSIDPAGDAFARKSSGPSLFVLLVLGLVGAGVGGWLGGPAATPYVADLIASAPSVGGGGSHGEEESYGGGASEEGDEEPLAIDNLILNPAESGGSRFLIATLVLETDGEARAELEARDAEARDLLQTVLAVRTVDELSDIQLRDEIRQDLLAALNSMLGYEGVRRIFLPQFVIQ